jgi:hypothetical protein
MDGGTHGATPKEGESSNRRPTNRSSSELKFHEEELSVRKLTGLVATLTGLAVIAAGAFAGEVTSSSGQVQTLEAGHSSTKTSKKKQPRGVRVTIKLSLRKTDGSKASPTTRAVVRLPKGIGLNYRDFPTCDQRKLEANGPSACPSKSRVGTGRIEADARPVLPQVGGTVRAFNGKNRTYLLYVVPEISSPLVIAGKLKGSKRSPRLDFNVPLVPTLPGQPNATLTYFEVKTGAKIKKRKRVRGKRRRVTVNYIENPRGCSRKSGWNWQIDFTYENGETLSPTDQVRCKR